MQRKTARVRDGGVFLGSGSVLGLQLLQEQHECAALGGPKSSSISTDQMLKNP